MSGKKHDGEVDIFEPAGVRSGSVSSVEHIETETNVFSMDTLRRAAAQHGGTDTGSFEVSAPKPAVGEFELSAPVQTSDDVADFDPSTSTTSGKAVDDADFEPPAPKRPVIDDSDDPLDDIDDPLDDDFPPNKGGFFSKLFRFGARDKVEEDLDDLSLDDDMFIAPPPASERAAGNGAAAPTFGINQPSAAVTDSGVFELGPSTDKIVSETIDEAVDEQIDEPASVSTATEVTDSGVFEFRPSTDKFGSGTTDEVVDEAVDEPASVSTVPEVTDSGVFEFRPSTDKFASGTTDEAVDEPIDEPADVSTVPEVTDSGVFEFRPSTAEPVSETFDAAVDERIDEPASVSTATEVTDSGVFEFRPSTAEPVSEATEVTDSGIFELAPSAAAPHPHGAHKGGDEWEIGWEPEDDVAAAETGAETPPPVFTKLAHVCLYVKDLGRSVEFYGKLGFQKRFVFNRNGSLFGAYLEFGDGNFIELFEDVSRSAVAALGRLAHFCLETPDIDATMKSLSARGIEFSPKKLGCDSTYQIWLKDPDGNEFEVHQYTAESSQIVGGEVEADW